MTDTTHERDLRAWRLAPSRRMLAAVLLASLLAGAAAAITLRGSSHRRAGQARASTAQRAARGTALADAGAPAAGTGSAVARPRPAVPQVRDPQEASSFPAPASARHAAAAAPRKAGEAVVAAGAPSDAEVRAELQQMEKVERSARAAARQRLAAVPGGNSIGGDGTIPVPQNVPEAVQRVIAGANAIANFPYVFGGGHASFVDNAYDCSGSVSYALAAGGLLSAPETSGELESWGVPGPGRYITVLANPGHTYMYVNAIMYNTSGRSGVYASRWQTTSVDNSGFVARHWPGL